MQFISVQFQLIGCAVIDLSPSGNFENSQRISIWAGIGEADDAPSSRHGASRSGRCNVLATLPRLNEAGGSGDTRARSLEMRRSAGMANGSQSALKSLTSGGRLAALEVTGFGSGALVAGTSTLYSPNGRPWGCRHCYRLTYATRQAVPRDRHLLRAQRIRRRLGGSPNMLEDFPPRPKGMHWQRYERMRDVHDLAQGKAMMGFMQFVDRLECRVGIRR